MHLFTAPQPGLPCHRAEGLGASAALHVAAFLFFAALPPPALIAPRTPALILTQVSEDSLVTSPPPEAAPLPDTDTGGDGDPGVEDGTTAPSVEVGGHEFDIGKIRRQRDALFPFVTAPLPFVDAASRRLEGPPPRLVNPFGPERRTSDLPALQLSPAELQRTIDRAWSRRERWRNFSEIAALLEQHDPDAGDAAALVHGHVEQNLLQPYNDTVARDPRFWVTLGLAADHAPLIDFVGRYVRTHPSSRVSTELLFMLDEFAQASRDAMVMLLATDPWRLLDETRAADAEAFAFAVSLHEQYTRWARGEGLHRTADIRERFDDVRIRILETIVASSPGGYGAGDARFLLGRIFWERNDVAGALRWWRDIAPDGRGSYAAAAAAVAREAAFPGGASAAEISAILGAEYRRWLTSSAARLQQFGHTFDTF